MTDRSRSADTASPDSCLADLEIPVPVTMGSNRFLVRDAPHLTVTLASFPAGAFLEPHVHDRPTFAIILDGGFDLSFTSPAIRRSYLPSPPGSIFTEPAGERHSNLVGPTGARVLVVQPDAPAMDFPEPCSSLLDRINHFRDGQVSTAAHRCARELVQADNLTPIAVEGLALQMLADAARLDTLPASDRRSPPPWLRRVVEYIHAHATRSIRIEEVATVAGVHPAHLAAVFQAVHRMPIATYIRRLRIERAADRLALSDEPVAQIASATGFSDQAHLTRWFKRVTGQTPAAYRRARSRRPTDDRAVALLTADRPAIRRLTPARPIRSTCC